MIIHLQGRASDRIVWINGKKLLPRRSLKYRVHSPDGFNWGYGGSGPAQLALGIVLELFNSPEGYQDFKFKYIAALPGGADFDLDIDITEWVDSYHSSPTEKEAQS